MKKLSIIVLTLGLFLTACAGTEVPPQNGGEGAGNTQASKVTVVGSTSVQSLAQEIADTYKAGQVDYQGVGSSAGIKAAIDGTADIGSSSRALKEEEKAAGLKQYEIAYDGIAVALHPGNKVDDLSLEQVTAIFKGEIKNWSEVGGDDQEIILISRESGSGTRDAFEEIAGLIVDKASALSKEALIADGNGAVKQNIASKKNAVGYLSIGYLDSSVKAVKIGGVEATEANVKAGSYKIMRPFLFVTKGEETAAAKAFIEYVLSDAGQKVVAENYISVK